MTADAPSPPSRPRAADPGRVGGAVSGLAWLAPVAFALATAGAVDPAAAAALAAFFLLHALLAPAASAAEAPRALRWALAAVLLACVVQLVPLPEVVRRVLAPGPTSARSDLRALGLAGAWAPISVDVGATVLEAVLWAGAAAALAVLARGEGPPRGARVAIGALVALHVAAVVDWVAHAHVLPLTHIEDPWGVGQAQLRGTEFSGWLVNRNHWAALGLVLWPLAAVWGFGGPASRRATPRRLLAAAVAAVVAAAVVLSRSRAGLGVLALQALALLAWVAARAAARVRLGMAAAVAVAAILLAGPVRSHLARLRAEDVVGRGALYVASARMAADSPVVGWGMGSFQSAFPAYQPEGALYKYSHAHCDPLECVAGGGVLGAALVLGLAAGLVRGLRDARATGLVRSLWALSLLGGAAAACVEFPLQIPAVRFVWLGVLFAGPPRRAGASVTPPAPDAAGTGS